MDPERPIFWHQGLFLQPQHFQFADLYHHSCLNAVRQSTAPFLWGIKSLEIEKAALANRTVSIAGAEFVFPDGTLVSIPANGLVQSRTLDQAWVEDGSPLEVYAAIKKLDLNGRNVTVTENLADLSEITTRYAASPDPEDAVDIHEAGPIGQVRQLYHVVKIFLGPERDQLGDYVFLPVARVVRDGDAIILSPDFIPPAIVVEADELLMSLLKETRDLLAAKGFQLEEYKKQRGIHSAEFGSRDMVYLLALRSLNRYIPALFHAVETGAVHPWNVYGLLRQLVGELSSFSEDTNVLGRRADMKAGLPPYDHWAIYKCFSTVLKTVTALIEEIAAGPEYIISLDYDGTYYAAELRSGMFQTGNRYYLAIRTNQDAEETKESVERSAKLSSREYLPILIARALPGIRLTYLPVPPQELPRRAGTCYFQIDVHSDQWTAVEQGKNIALYWDSAPDDAEAELMMVEAG